MRYECNFMVSQPPLAWYNVLQLEQLRRLLSLFTLVIKLIHLSSPICLFSNYNYLNFKHSFFFPSWNERKISPNFSIFRILRIWSGGKFFEKNSLHSMGSKIHRCPLSNYNYRNSKHSFSFSSWNERKISPNFSIFCMDLIRVVNFSKKIRCTRWDPKFTAALSPITTTEIPNIPFFFPSWNERKISPNFSIFCTDLIRVVNFSKKIRCTRWDPKFTAANFLDVRWFVDSRSKEFR